MWTHQVPEERFIYCRYKNNACITVLKFALLFSGIKIKTVFAKCYESRNDRRRLCTSLLFLNTKYEHLRRGVYILQGFIMSLQARSTVFEMGQSCPKYLYSKNKFLTKKSNFSKIMKMLIWGWGSVVYQ